MPEKPAASILIPVSPGEILDKLTILEIKSERMSDPAKLGHVQHEADLLRDVAEKAIRTDESVRALAARLRNVNEDLWTVEGAIVKNASGSTRRL